MKDIKFRAWSKTQKRFYFNIEQDTVAGLGAWLDDKDMIINQYTGVKDKNGKYICEGDIVKYKIDRRFTSYEYDPKETHRIQHVYWKEDRLAFALSNNLKNPQKSPFYPLWEQIDEYNEIEVIGNIYETPWKAEKDEF